jgi:hypothetical protein
MLKWHELEEGQTLYEAFLPEHDLDPQEWLLRAVRRGHVVAERRVPLVWRPTFGPDGGDIAALEAALESLIADLGAEAPPTTDGSYVRRPVEIAPPDPWQHASQYSILEEFTSAISALEFGDAEAAAWLELPSGYPVVGLLPVGVTSSRYQRMRQVVALYHLVEHNPLVSQRKDSLIAALLREDRHALQIELEAAGVVTASTDKREA